MRVLCVSEFAKACVCMFCAVSVCVCTCSERGVGASAIGAIKRLMALARFHGDIKEDPFNNTLRTMEHNAYYTCTVPYMYIHTFV